MKRQSKIVFMSVTEEWIKGVWSTGVASKGLFKGDLHNADDNTVRLSELTKLLRETPREAQRHSRTGL
jgi:hypothetical protein